MSITLAFENDDVVWIDAVTTFSESRAGRVTEHPVENGSVISDTIIKDAPSFSLSGIISNADLMFGRPLDIENYDGVLNQTAFYPVKISGNKPGSLSKLLPESVSFFVSEDTPSVEFDGDLSKFDFAAKVKERLRKAHNDGESLALMEFDSGLIKDMLVDLYIQNISFNETPDTGDALEFSLTLTKVVKVTLQSAKVGSVSAANYGSNASGSKSSTTTANASPDYVNKAAAGSGKGPRNSELSQIKGSLSDWLTDKFGPEG